MMLGRVIGTVVSTIQHKFLEGKKLLLVERVDSKGKPSGGTVIALDSIDAGAGETVLVLDEGNSARQVFGDPSAPVRTVIVGVVDSIDAEK
jgi:ethanolamine utilization protein EutN